MYISIKNSKNFEQSVVDEISKFLISRDFIEQFKSDVSNYHQKETRHLIQLSSNLFLVRHSEFAHTDNIPTELFLSSHDSYGLIDLFKVGGDANKSSLLYWFVHCRSKFILPTQIGIFCKNAEHSDKVIMQARMDDLWIASNATSTVFALDSGSSHLQT